MKTAIPASKNNKNANKKILIWPLLLGWLIIFVLC